MPNPGDVVWVAFPGAVDNKQRPVVVVSSDEYHSTRPDIIVGLLTSQVAKSRSSTDYVLVDWQAAGLKLPSAFRAYLATIAKSKIKSVCGRLSPTDWQAVKDCMQRAIAS